MGFSKKIKYFLVHTLGYTNQQAQTLITTGDVEINGARIFENHELDQQSEIKVKGQIRRTGQDFVYLKFYKPTGYESSMNQKIKNNLAPFFNDKLQLAIAGRLDKTSEGLMLLSNDGKWVEKMCNPKFEKEKEYLVTLDKKPNQQFIDDFRNGVRIGQYITQPCFCELTVSGDLKVILKEGKNRQIRRMCHALGFSVTGLKRTRIAGIGLDGLAPGEVAQFLNMDL